MDLPCHCLVLGPQTSLACCMYYKKSARYHRAGCHACFFPILTSSIDQGADENKECMRTCITFAGQRNFANKRKCVCLDHPFAREMSDISCCCCAGRAGDAAEQPEGAGAAESRVHHSGDCHCGRDLLAVHRAARPHERVQGKGCMAAGLRSSRLWSQLYAASALPLSMREALLMMVTLVAKIGVWKVWSGLQHSCYLRMCI